MITQAMIDRFYRERHPHDEYEEAYYAGEEALMFAILHQERDLWVELVLEEGRRYFPVITLDELRAVTEVYTSAALLAVTPGIDPPTAYALDEARSQETESTPRNPQVIWMGDFDRYGAECGTVLALLLPRPTDAPLDEISQQLVDQYGLDEAGHLKAGADEADVDLTADDFDIDHPWGSDA